MDGSPCLYIVGSRLAASHTHLFLKEEPLHFLPASEALRVYFLLCCSCC
jgi:hypothetical protein